MHANYGIHADRDGTHWTESTNQWVTSSQITQIRWKFCSWCQFFSLALFFKVGVKLTLKTLWSSWAQKCWQRQQTWSESKSWEMLSKRYIITHNTLLIADLSAFISILPVCSLTQMVTGKSASQSWERPWKSWWENSWIPETLTTFFEMPTSMVTDWLILKVRRCYT